MRCPHPGPSLDYSDSDSGWFGWRDGLWPTGMFDDPKARLTQAFYVKVSVSYSLAVRFLVTGGTGIDCTRYQIKLQDGEHAIPGVPLYPDLIPGSMQACICRLSHAVDGS